MNALGPFITSKKNEKLTELGFRPFFYSIKDGEKNSSEMDILYPFATYDKRDGNWRFQLLAYLLYLESEKTKNGFSEREFNLFPFIFSKRAEDPEDSYFALFPFFGKMKNKFYKDEISFVLFPLFLQTRNGDEINRSFLWPFFGYYNGGGQSGFRFWPLFGYRKKEEKLDEKFVLWPFIISSKRVFYGEERSTFSILPFYTSFESPNFTNKTYFWPFFNYVEDKKRGFKQLSAPWPFIGFTRGTREGNRFFPFYADYMGEGGGGIVPFYSENSIESRGKGYQDRDGFILWPLYRYSSVTLEDYRRSRKSILLILYKEIKDEPIIEGGTSGRRINLWPLFSYRRDNDGNRSFQFFSLLEPLVSGVDGLERNYSPLWRFFEWKKYSDGRTVTSFLWNTFRTEYSEEATKVSLQPIIPIFSYTRAVEGSKTLFFGGLFGYQNTGAIRKLKFLFVPITIGSGEKEENMSEEVGEQYNYLLSNHR
ncbi:MAG: hypothetical protein HY693_00275 [Deltaproteobacteria bacterium]|nr:hypothetical protein [Deltaproteobacteria bacterium]